MTYVYNCSQCGRQFGLRRPVAERDEPAECAACGGAARRVFGAGVVVKTAWWWNDWTGADIAPDPDKSPEFARKSWPTTGYARPRETRGRF